MTSEAERKRLQRERKENGTVVLPPLEVPGDAADEFLDYAIELGLFDEAATEENRVSAVHSGFLAAFDEWLRARASRREARLAIYPRNR